MAPAGFTWIIEGDVKACFDEISHKAILGCIKEKVIDNKFLKLIQLPSEGGREIDGAVHPTTKGVPRGVASPRLANAVLTNWTGSSIPRGSTAKGPARGGRNHNLPNIRFARYADDWCVFSAIALLSTR